MWGIKKVTDEDDWFESYVKLALSVAPAGLPASRQKLGATSIQWFETEPGIAFIDARGGTINDRVLATEYVKSMLAGHGYRVAQYEIDYGMEKTGKWGDIMAKAKRLIQSGKVQLLRNGSTNIVGSVVGDHGTYQTEISREDPNSQAISQWQCDCPWDQYAWQRTRQWKKYEGRPCAHVLATFWKSQATPVDEDAHPATQYTQQQPGQPMPPTIPGRTFGPQDPMEQGVVAPGFQPAMQQGQGIMPGLPGGAPLTGPAGMPYMPGPGQAMGTPPIPGLPPEILPPFPMEGQLEPQPPQVSIPGAKPQTPLNPMQWPGGTLSSTKIASDFVQCLNGHWHWGPAGAAGLMLNHTDDQGVKRYLLQKRSSHVDHPNTWSIPGGAINPGESPEQGAHREASEEFGQLPPYQVAHTNSADCGGWKYHTVHGTVDSRFDPDASMVDPEYGMTEGSGHWLTPEEIDTLPLHPGFANAWHGNRQAFSGTGWDQPFMSVVNPQPAGFENGAMAQIIGTDMGIAEGPDTTNPMHGQYMDIRSNTKGIGEVMGTDELPGLGHVIEVIFPLDKTGPLQPYHIRAWLRPEQVRLRPDIQKPGPMIKRRR